MEYEYDYCGYATKNNIRCSDGKTILKDAFKECDGKTVPVAWNHQHNDIKNVLGHALLENRDDGVYAYIKFNDAPSGKNAKILVENGDISSLSIYANQLKQSGGFVQHGVIREVSLVYAGANPGAYIDTFIKHGLMSDEQSEDEAVIYSGQELELYHADDGKEKPEMADEKKKEEPAPEEKKDDETIEDVFNTLNDKQKTMVYALVGQALDEKDKNKNDDTKDGDDNVMKHNAFEENGYVATDNKSAKLTHADEEAIMSLAKEKSVGSFQAALQIFAEEKELDGSDSLKHSFDEIEALFPDYKDVRPGAPELITRDLGWVDAVINKANKSPFSRIKTRQVDARQRGIRAKGYKTGTQKTLIGNSKIIRRSTDPQTIYVKDSLDRDTILDITDFDVAAYQYGIMRNTLKEELALATMVGDGREDEDADKIKEEHIRPIWTDDETYTIHVDVDIEAAKTKLNGTRTGEFFGDEYVYAEAIIAAALRSRKLYKGTGKPDYYCTIDAVNTMLLARDLNGRRIYDSISDLEKALNVGKIYTVEQFEGLVRADKQNKQHELLGIMVNMSDYDYGSTKGGQITSFEDFDIDFNQHKYLIETRLCGALTRVASAIVLEKPVTSTTTDPEEEPAG